MPIDRLDFDNLSEADLAELVTMQVPEGLRLDYKCTLYGNSDAEKREALKDISAFANAFGGHLILGIEEHNGLPTAMPGIANVNPDDVMLRLEQLIRTGIEPRIQGIRIGAIRLANQAFCFVLRIPQSWYPPHRVSAQNSNRFWIRNSNGVHEASVEELRTLFTLASTAFDRVRQFRQERLTAIREGRGGRPLQGDGRLILHIVPLAAVSSLWQVDLDIVYRNHQAFRLIGTLGMSPRFNFDGFVNEYGDTQTGYTQIFRNGILEATKASLLRDHEGRKLIPGLALERHIFDVLPTYLRGLHDVGIPPPLVVMFTLEGVEGAVYAVRQHLFDESERILDRSLLCLPECVINEYATDIEYHRAVKPAFDALWNAAGFVSAQTFSADGQWIGDQRRR
jgi:hypothetical protein